MGLSESKVDISVVIISYNQVKTIQKAIDSVLAQRTSASYEIIVIDDASDDGTRDVLDDYAKRYPQLIRLFIRKYNSGYPTKNIYHIVKEKACGKYIALLEGDDYWIDYEKLEKQYSFLLTNDKYSAVTTDIRCVDDNGNNLSELNIYKKMPNNVFTISDYYDLSCPGCTATLFFRNPFMLQADCRIWYRADYMMGDMSLYAILLVMGDIYQMDNKTAVYRVISKEGEVNFNSLRLGNAFMDLRFIRYFIRIENYIRTCKDDDYRIVNIDECIKGCAGRYKWADLREAVTESKDKSRIVIAAMYHFLSTDDRYYRISDYLSKERIKSWKEFMKDNRPVVLFGAGAIAAEFLNRYSFRKKVRFIVDNDETKIGKSYKGYLVKRPEEIMNFKGKVSVLITNEKHEKDIAKQLRNMGISDYYLFYSMRSASVKNQFLNLVDRLTESD